MVEHRWQLEADARHALVTVKDALGACRSKVVSCISEYDAELLALHAKIDKLQVQRMQWTDSDRTETDFRWSASLICAADCRWQ